jgi:predicted lipoprotein with Yx(FWY)xxD motif
MDQRRHPGRRAALWAAPVALLAATAAACGSSTATTSVPTTPASSAPAAPAAPAATGSAATVTTTDGALGTFLASGDGRTLYLFEKDSGTTSSCSGACAVNWPPLLTKTAPQATGQAQAKMLGTAPRSDGTTQVTYAGHPLYLFVGDKAAGSTTGEGVNAFGGEWYVVSPSGDKIESAPASTSSGGGGGY